MNDLSIFFLFGCCVPTNMNKRERNVLSSVNLKVLARCVNNSIELFELSERVVDRDVATWSPPRNFCRQPQLFLLFHNQIIKNNWKNHRVVSKEDIIECQTREMGGIWGIQVVFNGCRTQRSVYATISLWWQRQFYWGGHVAFGCRTWFT